MTDTILELKNIRKVFKHDIFKKKQIAIENISCRFPNHRCTGLLGHNGAGKTTAIRIILGLIKPDRGAVHFKGKKISRSQKRHIGYMPEVSKLSGNLTPIEIMKYHLMAYQPEWLKSSERNSMIEKTLRQVGLWEVRTKKIKKLSKGMGRRLAWAQATVHKPDLVILDEPFSGLDPLARQDLLGWIRDFKNEGRSLILCTHELWSVQALCDDVHVFKKGKLAYSTIESVDAQIGSDIMGTNYKLTITGANKVSDLEGIANKHNLKRWRHLEEDKHLITLYFTEYPVASQWLSACNDQGLVIVKFTDELSIEDREIRELFQGGQLQ